MKRGVPPGAVGRGMAANLQVRHEAAMARARSVVGEMRDRHSRCGDGPCRLLLVSEQPVVLAGLYALLADDPAFQLVDGDMAADVVVLDVVRWDEGASPMLRRLRYRHPGARVLLLVGECDGAAARAFLDAGGSGAVRTRAAAEHLLDALHRVARGETYVDDAIVQAQALAAGGQGVATGGFLDDSGLSEREFGVLRRKVQGLSNKAIAADLGISVKTVETYQSRGMEKLGLQGRAEMLRYAVRHGWLAADLQGRSTQL